MADSIRIIITSGCDANGQGGTVVDDATSILDPMPDGTSLLSAIVGAFAAAYGVHEVGEVKVSMYRNFTYRVRLFVTEVVSAFIAKKASEKAAESAKLATDAAMNSVRIVEGRP